MKICDELHSMMMEFRIKHKPSRHYDSSMPLEHIRALIKTNPDVINPVSEHFNGPLLADVVVMEFKKFSDPMSYLLVANRLLGLAQQSMGDSVSQDELMEVKHRLVRNMICNLYQDSREEVSMTLTENKLNQVACKLLFIMDNLAGTGDPQGFKALELWTMTDFMNKYLHGNHFVDIDPIIPAASDWKILDKVLGSIKDSF